jgi:hypothetical protein
MANGQRTVNAPSTFTVNTVAATSGNYSGGDTFMNAVLTNAILDIDGGISNSS